MNFRTKFDVMVYDGTFNNLPSLTQQHFKDDCDINVLFKRFVSANNGLDPLDMMPHYDIDMSRFDDVPVVNGLQGMFERADEANTYFMQLPPDVREKFGNDPARLRSAIESFNDPKELEKYGLFVKGVNTNATQSIQQVQPTDFPTDGAAHPQA